MVQKVVEYSGLAKSTCFNEQELEKHFALVAVVVKQLQL